MMNYQCNNFTRLRRVVMSVISCISHLSLFFVLGSYSAMSAPQAGDRYGGVDVNKYPTNITADYFQVKGKERKFFYQGKVKVFHNGMILNADRVDGTYDSKNQIDKLTAVGDVILDNGKGIHATGGRAVYGASSGTVVLTESPEVTENGSTVAADKITVFIKENRSEATGRVRMRVAPKDLQKAKMPATATPSPSATKVK